MIYIKTQIKSSIRQINYLYRNFYKHSLFFIIDIMIEKVQISDLELSEIYAKGKGVDPWNCKLDEIINSGMHVGLVIQEE